MKSKPPESFAAFREVLAKAMKKCKCSHADLVAYTDYEPDMIHPLVEFWDEQQYVLSTEKEFAPIFVWEDSEWLLSDKLAEFFEHAQNPWNYAPGGAPEKISINSINEMAEKVTEQFMREIGVYL